MTLRLTVIGGAAAWPNAGQACSAYLLSTDTHAILVDCGSGALQELRKHVDFAAIDAIVISHCHSDHILDLVAYRYALLYGIDPGARRIPLWLPPGGAARLTLLGDAFGGQGERYDSFWDAAFEIREYEPTAALLIGPFVVSFARTQHFVECYAMRFDVAGAASIAYSADTGAIDSLVPLFRGVSIAIVEATVANHGDTPPHQRGHLTPENAGELAERAGVDGLVLTHLWQERAADAVISAAATMFRGPIHVARPGLVLDA